MSTEYIHNVQVKGRHVAESVFALKTSFGLVHFDNLFLFNAHQNSHEYMGIQVSEVSD